MTVVAGDSFAALVAADALAARGRPVTLYLPERASFGGWAPMRMGRWDLSMGLRLLEVSYGPEDPTGPEPALADYEPGMSGHRPYIRTVRRWFADLLGDDLVEVARPAMFVNGRMRPDIYLTVDLSCLAEALTVGQVSAMKAQVRSRLPMPGIDTLEAASWLNHGPVFHDLFIEAFCRKVTPAGSAGVLASMRRKLWMPLFRPETLWEALNGVPLGFQPSRPFHGATGLVGWLMDRLAGRGVTIVRGDWPSHDFMTAAVLGYGPETLYGCTLERTSLTFCWLAVREDDLLNLPSVIMIPDPAVTAFRVNAGGRDGRLRLVCVEGATLPEAAADLVTLGLIRDTAPVGYIHEMTVPAFAAPTAANRDLFDEAKAKTDLDGALVVGGACAFGADSLNEQIVQGLRAAEMLA